VVKVFVTAHAAGTLIVIHASSSDRSVLRNTNRSSALVILD
jgi:hypothetical protein